MGNSVNVEMFLLPFLLLVLPLSSPVSSKPSGPKENVKDEETMYKSENLDYIVEELEKKLETKNVNVENHQKQLKEMEVQFESKVEEEVVSLKSEMTELQNQLKEVKAEKKNQNQETAKSLKSEVENQLKAEVKKELDKVLPAAVEQGLRDMPFEMVCAYKYNWDTLGVVNYDQISEEFNNSNRPGGADGLMNIETGVFTALTSGYYIITFSAHVQVHAGESTVMWLHHNGVQVEESQFVTSMKAGSGDNYIIDQGSRTVILHLLRGDTVDLRTEKNSYGVWRINFCLYMVPAPYGL